MQQHIDTLTELVDKVPELIRNIPAENLDFKKASHQWSKKEILGHLVDSAANNHQRLVRLQYEIEVAIVYDQDRWVAINNYHQEELNDILMLWVYYNRHLIHLVRNTNLHALPEVNATAFSGLFIDYLQHMQHHLAQILEK